MDVVVPPQASAAHEGSTEFVEASSASPLKEG